MTTDGQIARMRAIQDEHERAERADRAGRPLGEASGGDPGFWDRLGVDNGMMPAHLPMGVTADGQGPENDQEAHHWTCWCGDIECPLSLALGHAWSAGVRAREARA